jgi:hypothetical protein
VLRFSAPLPWQNLSVSLCVFAASVAVSLTNGESWVTVTDANRNTKTINFNNVIISCYQKQHQSGEGLILWMVLVMVLWINNNNK